MVRIVFMGTPDFAVPSLRTLAAAGYDLQVITQPDRPAGRGAALTPPPVKVAATALGLPVWQPPTLRDPAVVTRLQEIAPLAIVVVAYGEILRRAVLDLPPAGCLNLHPSLLPRWRGPTPIPAAILAGDALTGVSVMRLDAGMDSGPLLAQARDLPIRPADTAGTLGARLAEQGAALLAATLAAVLAGTAVARPQPAAGVTICRLLRKEDGRLDWAAPAAQLARQVRAYDPWPGTYTTWQNRRLRVPAACLLEDAPAAPDAAPGTVRRLADLLPASPDAARRLVVRCGAGWLELFQVQLEGKGVQPAAAFLRGYPALLGAVLG